MRARVVWIQRPRSVREMFQIAVELESSGNIWGVEPPAADWEQPAPNTTAPAAPQPGAAEAISAWLRVEAAARTERERTEKMGPEMENPLDNVTDKNMEPKGGNAAPAGDTAAFGFAGTVVPEAAEAGLMDSPLVREIRAQLESQATKAAEDAISRASETLKTNVETLEREHAAAAELLFRKWREDFDRDRDSARDEVTHRAIEQMAHVQDEIAARVTGQMSWVREELRADMKQEFGSHIDQMRALVANLEQGAEAVRKEADAAVAAGDRLAQIKIALDAAEAAVDQRMRRLKEAAQESVALDDLSKAWRQKLEEQMGQARGEWDELLQSSLDAAAHRMAGRLAESTHSELQSAEGRLGERLASLSQPVAAAVSEAQQALTGIRAALDGELQRARTSLVDIENAAERMREFSAQIDAASHDAVNQLYKRLDSAVQSQVNELQRHADALTTDLPLRIQPALDAAAEQLVAKTLADLDGRLVPHLERVPELVRELTAHEVQAEESLRIHRERLRQAAESSRRDAASQMAASLTDLRGEFEKARNEALARWNEEMDSIGARATHSAVEGLVRNVEWHQRHAQQYIETLTQEALGKTNTVFDAQSQDAQEHLAVKLTERLEEHLAEAKRQLESASATVIERAGSH
ncbi:MAG TPA: hypothetical protein VEJ39_07930, partial [Candidatus Acidoferrales bacterium]|nr:hypothetical protein [Candidatus Acidoferrales bacterium]